MNTKKSSLIGWVAYTAAFIVGGGIGIYRYWYAPGGRADREKEFEKLREQEAAMEAIQEERIRQERRAAKLQHETNIKNK